MTIFLGANDAVLPGQRQHVPLDDYRNNLKELIGQVKAHCQKTRVILITPPPVDPARWSTPRHTEPDRTVENTKQYRDVCLEVAQELCIVAVDTWELFLGPSLECTPCTTCDVLNDGLHFDTKGNQLLGTALLETIKKHWPELEPEGMKSMVAWHDQVDKTDLPKTLFRFDRAHGGGL